MKRIEIKRDGSLAGAYFFLAVVFALIALYRIFIDDRPDAGYPLLGVVGLLTLVALYFADPRPLLTIDENGIKPKYKARINWPEIYQIVMERRSFENNFYHDFAFFGQNGKSLFRITLKRHNFGPGTLVPKLKKLLAENFQDHIEIVRR